MKYFFPAILLVSVALYIVNYTSSSQMKVSEENEPQSNTQLILPETNDVQGNMILGLNTKLEKGYKTKEYYLYDMSIRCSSFVRNDIRTRSELDEYLVSIFPQDTNQTFDLALTNEMRHRFEICKKFLDEMLDISVEARKTLLDKALDRKDLSAFARKAFNEVFMKKEKISSVKTILIESLVANNPEALYTLSMIVQQFSEVENRHLIGAALMSRACDAGYGECGYNSLMVQQTCKEESICGSNLQETIRMSVPNNLTNEFENTLIEINYIKTEIEWDTFFNATINE